MKRLALLAACVALFAAPALADPSVKVVCLTTGTSWTVPSDFTSVNTVELIGAGGFGANNPGNGFDYGGGAGAYSGARGYSLTIGASVTIQVGSNKDTCFSSCLTQKAAKGETAGSPSYPGPGGTVANSVGTTLFKGGSGSLGGAGGGAGGPNGAGANATNAPNQGGAGDAGSGGAGGLNNGGDGAEWTCTSGDITGPAGSGGGAGANAGFGTAGHYGAGGFSSARGGLIVITYSVRRTSGGVF